MIRATGDMFSIVDTTDHFIVTTNSFIKKNGELVMGKGIAKQLKDYDSTLPKQLGSAVAHHKTPNDYGLVLVPKTGIQWWGAFQVKHYWGHPAELALIQHSTNELSRLALQHPGARFDLNYPGIGNGQLTMADVAPIVETLPNNVHVWTLT